MIPGGGGSSLAAGIMPFPHPPKGSPGEIRNAGHSLRLAADDLHSAHGTLELAAGMLGSWEGQAAVAYHACVQGLSRVMHGGVSSLHAVAAAVLSYASALDGVQSGMRRLRPPYDAAVRRAQSEAGTVTGLQAALPSASTAERGRLDGLITGAAGRAQSAVDEANGYAGKAQRLLDDFQREAGRQGAQLAPLDMQLFGGRFGAPVGAPGPGFGAGSIDGGFAQALAPFSGVIPLQLPEPHGPSVFASIMNGIQAVSGVVSTASGACAALLFWNGVGEVCGGVGGISSAVGAGAGVGKAIAGDGSIGSAAVGVVEAVPGIASYKLGEEGGRLVKAGEDLTKGGDAAGGAIKVTAGRTRQALGGVIDGLGGTASSRSLGELAKGAEPPHVTPGTVDKAAGEGIATELGEIEIILGGPGPLGGG